MKPSEIKVGVTYLNKGAGTTWRKVLAIGDEYKPYGNHPNEPGVLYENNRGGQHKLYLSSFAAWVGGVKEE